MFINKFKNVNLENNRVDADFEPVDQLHKFFLTKAAKHFPLMVRNRYNTFPFHTTCFFILLNDISSILGFIYFPGSFVQLFCFNCVIVDKRIYHQFFHFFFVESFRLFSIFQTFSQLRTKIYKYTINPKNSLQTKTWLS